MTSTPKTIQIFLPSGEPHGIRIAEITTRIVQVIEVPRSLLADFLAMEQSGQVGVYFLIGEASEEGGRLVYVGQTGDLSSRLSAHNQKKDFWDRALVLISRTNSLTQTHALFLEWHALKQIRDAGRFADENGNSGSKPHTPAPLEAECLEIFETCQTLISCLGFPLFDQVVSASSANAQDELLFCRSPGTGVDGRGLYTAEGFVVLKGSIAREAMTPSTTPVQKQWRQGLIERGVLQPDGQGGLVFTRDHLFQTPSGGAIALMGRRANGWTEWKDAQGRTLHQLHREPKSTAD